MAQGDRYSRRGNYARSVDVITEIFNATVVNGGTSGQLIIDCSGFESVLVVWRLVGTVTTAELTAFSLLALPDQTNMTPRSLAGLEVPTFLGATAAGGDVYDQKKYDCRGWGKLATQANNGNAAPKQMTCNVFLGGSRA